jgi:hypothetical protein
MMVNDVRLTFRRSALASDILRTSETSVTTAAMDVMLIEHDRDCADALQSLLASIEGVGTVYVAATAGAALEAIEAKVIRPRAIFFATQADTPTLTATLIMLRRRVPEAIVVLLCVYPECHADEAAGFAVRCLSKDTGRRELVQVLSGLTDRQTAAD